MGIQKKGKDNMTMVWQAINFFLFLIGVVGFIAAAAIAFAATVLFLVVCMNTISWLLNDVLR